MVSPRVEYQPGLRYYVSGGRRFRPEGSGVKRDWVRQFGRRVENGAGHFFDFETRERRRRREFAVWAWESNRQGRMMRVVPHYGDGTQR